MNNFQTMVGIQVGLAAIAITLLCVPGNAFADEVFLKNGDRISGTVISKTGDVLVLDTKYAGEIKINLADVSGMYLISTTVAGCAPSSRATRLRIARTSASGALITSLRSATS